MTLKYFDLFDYPLKKEEIWRWLIGKSEPGMMNYELRDFNEVLEKIFEHKIIQVKNGYYFLSGREDIVTTRQIREEESFKKIKKARRIAGLS